jgi:hypothetical protein
MAKRVEKMQIEGQTDLFDNLENQPKTKEKKQRGRPCSKIQDKKIQVKFYLTPKLREQLEWKGRDYGLTSSQLAQKILEKVVEMRKEKLEKFLGIEEISTEGQKQFEEFRSKRRHVFTRYESLNAQRMHSFSFGKVTPAEILETVAFFQFDKELKKTEGFNLSYFDEDFLKKKGFRYEEARKINRIIRRALELICKENKDFTDFHKLFKAKSWDFEFFEGTYEHTSIEFDPEKRTMEKPTSKFFKLLTGEK